jgi:hypothetical protein
MIKEYDRRFEEEIPEQGLKWAMSAPAFLSTKRLKRLKFAQRLLY